MNILAKPRASAETARPVEVEVEGKVRELVRADNTAQAGRDTEMTATNLSTLLRRVSGSSTREIDNLIAELQTLRERLRADGNRVERDIMEYAALNQSVIQLTKIISESMTHAKKVPDAPSIGEENVLHR